MANGFFTDTTLCIGCKACEVACKQWNQLPADGYAMTGMSYDNTGALGATTWRHVAFIEVPESKKRLPMATPAPPPAAVPSADGATRRVSKSSTSTARRLYRLAFQTSGSG